MRISGLDEVSDEFSDKVTPPGYPSPHLNSFFCCFITLAYGLLSVLSLIQTPSTLPGSFRQSHRSIDLGERTFFSASRTILDLARSGVSGTLVVSEVSSPFACFLAVEVRGFLYINK